LGEGGEGAIGGELWAVAIVGEGEGEVVRIVGRMSICGRSGRIGVVKERLGVAVGVVVPLEGTLDF
jgi:hypothetical protein